MKNPVMLKNKFFLALCIGALCCSSTLAQRSGAPAQSGQSLTGADIKGRAPVNKEVLKVNLPKAQEATLSNGLRVVLLPRTTVPIVTMQMVIMSGGLADPADFRGLSTFTATLLREGTRTRKSKDIAEQVETLGATLQTTSALSAMTSNVTMFGLVENLDQMLDIYSDIIRNPTFPQEEVDKYKARQLQQLMFQRSIPQFLAQERFLKAIYGPNHPAGLATVPADSLKRVTSADLAKFHSTYYRPNNAILAIVGDVTLKQIVPKLEKAFAGWERGDVPAMNIPAAPAQGPARIQLIDRPGSVQTVLQLGNLGIERTSEDYFGMLVMNQVLGAGPAARLFLNLREKNGYTYGAYSNFNGSKFRGTLISSSEVRTDVTEGAMREFKYELQRLRDEKVPAVELENAKRAIVGGFALSLEQPQSLLGNIITQKIYDLPANYWETYPQKVQAITADDIQRIAQKYIDLDHLQIVAVGDASKTRAILAKFGAVEEYDAEGKPVKTAANGPGH